MCKKNVILKKIPYKSSRCIKIRRSCIKMGGNARWGKRKLKKHFWPKTEKCKKKITSLLVVDRANGGVNRRCQKSLKCIIDKGGQRQGEGGTKKHKFPFLSPPHLESKPFKWGNRPRHDLEPFHPLVGTHLRFRSYEDMRKRKLGEINTSCDFEVDSLQLF